VQVVSIFAADDENGTNDVVVGKEVTTHRGEHVMLDNVEVVDTEFESGGSTKSSV